MLFGIGGNPQKPTLPPAQEQDETLWSVTVTTYQSKGIDRIGDQQVVAINLFVVAASGETALLRAKTECAARNIDVTDVVKLHDTGIPFDAIILPERFQQGEASEGEGE